MKYRYVITCEGITADVGTEAEAKTAAMWEVDNSLSPVVTIELEPLTKGEGETE